VGVLRPPPTPTPYALRMRSSLTHRVWLEDLDAVEGAAVEEHGGKARVVGGRGHDPRAQRDEGRGPVRHVVDPRTEDELKRVVLMEGGKGGRGE
jgi:hypothetical protein